MKKIINLVYLFLVVVFINNAHAASGDSVMIAPTITTAPSMSYKPSVASSGNVYSYTSTTEYQNSVCPSGLTVNGSSIYHSAQRQTIFTYLGSQLVSSTITAWKDIDTDCIGYENQTLACPTGYNGTITQQRKIGTASNGNGSLQYDPWVTTANNCVPAGYTFNIIVGEYMSTGLWDEPYWGYSETQLRNFAIGSYLGYLIAYGSMNTVYYAGLRVTDIYWNGTPGYFTIFPNSVTIAATDGASRYSLICSYVAVNGTQLNASEVYYDVTTSYSNFTSVVSPYSYIGAKVQVTINNCRATNFGAW